ncbi:hypothetical protein BDY19DRAFT_899669, partial [Irpex rosettiformis]
KIVVKHKLLDRLMPCKVHTCWNLTYTMLSFAVEYKAAINKITDNRTMQLRDYELSTKE